MEPLVIQSGQGPYRVDFFPRLADAMGPVRDVPHAFYVIDRTVAELYAKPLAPLLAAPSLVVEPTEEEKTLAGVGRVVDALQRAGAAKPATLVAIGGGILQDIATFAAHVYYRGIRWAFVPTTLLSQCDSCIGAKCGINLNTFKNQLGVFHAPSQVFLCGEFVDSLAERDVASGYGEILKLMLTGSREQFARLERALADGGLRNPSLQALVYESLAVKKRIIEEDEYEKDLRRILNYGHTFGHALEALTNHAVPHGQAVAWGIDLVNFIAWKRGLLAEADFLAVHQLIRRHLPFRLAESIEAGRLIAAARRDKKAASGSVHLILLEQPGKLHIVRTPFDADLEGQIGAYLQQHNVFDSR